MTTTTTTRIKTTHVRIDRERDKYGRSVYRYAGWTEDREGYPVPGATREGAAIVRLPAPAHANPEHPAYGKPYMVNLDTVRGHLNPDEHVAYVGTLRAARAMVEDIPWVQEVRDSGEVIDYSHR